MEVDIGKKLVSILTIVLKNVNNVCLGQARQADSAIVVEKKWYMVCACI